MAYMATNYEKQFESRVYIDDQKLKFFVNRSLRYVETDGSEKICKISPSNQNNL